MDQPWVKSPSLREQASRFPADYCVGCKFFVKDQVERGRGRCHRFPPQVERPIAAANFPVVRDSDGCGEFVALLLPVLCAHGVKVEWRDSLYGAPIAMPKCRACRREVSAALMVNGTRAQYILDPDRPSIPETPAQPAAYASVDPLTFAELRAANVRRCEASFHPLDGWSPAEWSNALAGEGGEVFEAVGLLFEKIGKVSNLVKKIRRIEDKSQQAKDPQTIAEALELVARELADVIAYADLLGARLRIDLGGAVREKFNAVSDAIGSEVKL